MYSSNAFGNPDGSRTDIADLMSEYISLDKKFSLSSRSFTDDLKTRVIVGAKGSGKTLYLRRMKVKLKQNPAVYVNDIDYQLPSTDLVIRFSQCFPEVLLTEKWMCLWKYAILRSVISNILCNSDWNQGISKEYKDKLLCYQYKTNIFPQYSMPMSICTEAQRILTEYSTKNSFNKYSEKREWDEIEIIVGNILKNSSPIYFFIDYFDEEYENAPMYWMKCQMGLFYRVMRILRKDIYGSRLHIVISIRDVIMASICESEHSTRYLNEEHVNLLNWNYQSIKYFLENKITNLDDHYFVNEGYEKTINNWLGIDIIYDSYNNINEPIIKYIIKHTRLLPRDIIIIGNSLIEIKYIVKNHLDIDIEEFIVKKVSECSKIIGNELLMICANQININQMPQESICKGYFEVYTSISEYKQSTVQLLKDVLSKIKSDKLSWEQIETLNVTANKLMNVNCNIFDILWQNGGIGYIEEGSLDNNEIFFNIKPLQLYLPKRKKIYILHTCIIEAIGINVTPIT